MFTSSELQDIVAEKNPLFSEDGVAGPRYKCYRAGGAGPGHIYIRIQCSSDVELTISVHMYLICVYYNDISSHRDGIVICLFGYLCCSVVQKGRHIDVIACINEEIGEGMSGLAMSTRKFLESHCICLP